MVTRLEFQRGRLYAVVSDVAPGIDLGERFLVIGNELPAGEPGFQFTGTPSGRRNTVTSPRKRNADPVPVDA